MKRRAVLYIAAALVIIYFCVMFISQQIAINEKNREIGELEDQIKSVEEEKKKLQDEIDNAESRETIENIARDELGLVYPDERKYIDRTADGCFNTNEK